MERKKLIPKDSKELMRYIEKVRLNKDGDGHSHIINQNQCQQHISNHYKADNHSAIIKAYFKTEPTQKPKTLYRSNEDKTATSMNYHRKHGFSRDTSIKAQTTPSSYIELWKEELKSNTNTNEQNQTQLHWQCKQAWTLLKTPHNKQTHYEYLPKLKKIYEDMMTNQFPEHNKFVPTPGQKEIMTKIKSKHLPFKEIKKIINMKGRDLLWRYTLKALPKKYNKPCQLCGENETSEHIFFNCKAHNKNTQEIFNHILTKCGHTTQTWDVKILNHLQIPLIANLIAILFEKIWHKRNKLIHDEIVLTIHKEQIIQELIKPQRAAWERTQSIISKTLRIKSKQRSEEQNKLDSLISEKLLQFSRQWNSPLHSITVTNDGRCHQC
ncbi:hypothetical protein ACTFIZ_006735 [Dictyostelium cf. discoideum]